MSKKIDDYGLTMWADDIEDVQLEIKRALGSLNYISQDTTDETLRFKASKACILLSEIYEILDSLEVQE